MGDFLGVCGRAQAYWKDVNCAFEYSVVIDGSYVGLSLIHGAPGYRPAQQKPTWKQATSERQEVLT